MSDDDARHLVADIDAASIKLKGGWRSLLKVLLRSLANEKTPTPRRRSRVPLAPRGECAFCDLRRGIEAMKPIELTARPQPMRLIGIRPMADGEEWE